MRGYEEEKKDKNEKFHKFHRSLSFGLPRGESELDVEGFELDVDEK